MYKIYSICKSISPYLFSPLAVHTKDFLKALSLPLILMWVKEHSCSADPSAPPQISEDFLFPALKNLYGLNNISLFCHAQIGEIIPFLCVIV